MKKLLLLSLLMSALLLTACGANDETKQPAGANGNGPVVKVFHSPT